MKIWISLLVAVLTFSTPARSEDPECALTLLSAEQQTAAAFRAEIQRASDSYAANHPTVAMSLLRGSEFESLAAFDNGAMIYLASGGDIFRPLASYPRIQDYHLVDVLVEWVDSPAEFIFEVKRRLAELAPDAEVTVEERGFLKVISEKELAKPYRKEEAKSFAANVLSREGASEPLVLRVRWTSEALGAQDR